MKIPVTKIMKLKGNWKEVLNDSRLTVGKDPLPDYKEPSDKFKKEILIAEHSPIRDISIKWIWKNMPHWVTVHWVRHKWEKFVCSQRTDLTGIDRHQLPQDTPQSMIGEANIQHLIDTMRKRLCNCASPETRMYAESLKEEIKKRDSLISDVLVPNCIYRGGCPEYRRNCGYYKKFTEKYKDKDLTDIQTRYECYAKDFAEKIKSYNKEEE